MSKDKVKDTHAFFVYDEHYGYEECDSLDIAIDEYNSRLKKFKDDYFEFGSIIESLSWGVVLNNGHHEFYHDESGEYGYEYVAEYEKKLSVLLKILKIKVKITDYDAIAAIPWQNVKEYLTHSAWDKVNDVKYGSIWKYKYQVRDKRSGEFLDVILLLPENNEIVDYTLRMSELIEAMALATGKSQLEIYYGLINGNLGENS